MVPIATNFPTSLDALTNPATTDPRTSPSHAGQHADANDSIEALEAKVGVDSSAVTTSIDYKISRAVSTGDLTAATVIPGMAASPDIRVAGTNDDEFDQNTSGTPSGWTDVSSGAADAINTTSWKSHLYMKANAASGNGMKGIYKTAPSMPFTMTCKLSDMSPTNDYNAFELFVAEAGSTGKFDMIAPQHNGAEYVLKGQLYTNRTTFSTTWNNDSTVMLGRPPMYLRIVAHSSTNVDYLFSFGGFVFSSFQIGRNPGFTIGIVGMAVESNNATYSMEALVDWIRFT